jgi:hypothetical protein
MTTDHWLMLGFLGFFAVLTIVQWRMDKHFSAEREAQFNKWKAGNDEFIAKVAEMLQRDEAVVHASGMIVAEGEEVEAAKVRVAGSVT